MLLFTLVYNNDKEMLLYEINNMKEYLQYKGFNIGISESMEGNTHFIRIFSEEETINQKLSIMFNLYMSNILYKLIIEDFCDNTLGSFINETYFFLKYDELKEVKELCIKALKCDENTINDDTIYYINKKNSIVEKIGVCIAENKELNIDGFITFRMKDLREDIEVIIDKVVERYMVEKEYDEFIQLLKYFVDIQESKINELNIIIKDNGEYELSDENGNDMLQQLTSDLYNNRFSGVIRMEDMIISGLITNCPKKIIIHKEENSISREIIDTIKNVFTDRVSFCSGCFMCDKNKKCKKTDKEHNRY